MVRIGHITKVLPRHVSYVVLRRVPTLLGLLFLASAVLVGPFMERALTPPPARALFSLMPLSDHPSRSRFAFGLFVKGSDLSQLTHTEREIGRRADVFLRFDLVDGRFDAAQAARLNAGGYLTVLTLILNDHRRPDSSNLLQRIAAGAFDRALDQWAHALRDFSYPIVLRPLHEFNGGWYPWAVGVGASSPADFVRAWRHIVDRIRGDGATNVLFELCFARYNSAAAHAPRLAWASAQPAANPWAVFWPGDAYVDVVGVDVFNRPPDRWHTWQSFDSLFAPSYQLATNLSRKPIWIQELATTGVGGDKAAWITAAFRSVRHNYPRVESVTWFNYAHPPQRGDWAFDATSTCIGAMRNALQL